MTTKEEYKIIDRWIWTFQSSDIVSKVDFLTVKLDKEKCSHLFSGISGITIDGVPDSYEIVELGYHAFAHFDGLNRLLAFVPLYNYIGIDINPEAIAQFACKGSKAVDLFVQKGKFLFRDLDKYDNSPTWKIYSDNFGDLKYIAQIVINYKPQNMYTVILKPLDPKNDYCFFTVKDDNSKVFYHVYISTVDDNAYVSIQESTDGLKFKDLTTEFKDLTINSKKSIEELCVYIKNYFLNKGFRPVFSPTS